MYVIVYILHLSLVTKKRSNEGQSLDGIPDELADKSSQCQHVVVINIVCDGCFLECSPDVDLANSAGHVTLLPSIVHAHY